MYPMKYLFNYILIMMNMYCIAGSISLQAMHSQEPKITKQIHGCETTYTRPNYGGGCDIATYNPYTMTYKAHRNLSKKGLFFNVSYYADPRAIYIWLAQQHEKQEQQKTI